MKKWPQEVDWFLTKKREKKAIKKRKRWTRQRLDAARAKEYHKLRREKFGKRSRLIDIICGENPKQIPVVQTSLRLNVPVKFSMFDDPGGVIDFVQSFANTFRHRPISDIFVNMSTVDRHDLGAHALLDKVVDEIVAQETFAGRRLHWKGTYPSDPDKKRFIQAMGIIRQLKIKKHFLSRKEAEKVRVFERRCRHYVHEIDPFTKSDNEIAAAKFSEHINKCLARIGKRLTAPARSRLCQYVGEIIDNAEQHAGIVDWTIQGYIDMSMEVPQCEIVILNFGESFATTLSQLPADHYTTSQIAPYLDAHAKSGLFSTEWRRNDLLTVVALQSTVSSKNINKDTDRGQGTVALIEFFQKMTDELKYSADFAPAMYLVSGDTRILFDGKYRLQKQGEDGAKVIAFNKPNDPFKAPDPSAVMPLKNAFLPGTIIGIKFPVRAEVLEPAVERKT